MKKIEEARSAEEQARAAREERRRDIRIASANFMVAGVRYEGRPDVIKRHAKAGCLVRLVRDRGNRYSKCAIAVRLENGKQIGYVPEENARRLAPLLDQGAKCGAYMTKILGGERRRIPVVEARFYRADSSVDAESMARASGGRIVTCRKRANARRDSGRRAASAAA